jgi:tRNA (mo5U34)-methyltransferase
MIDPARALDLIRDRPWHHDFEIVPGVRTGGAYDPAPLWHELELPADLTGLAVADLGASNGYFSFEARRRGARVTAFDFRHKDNSGFGLAQHLNRLHDIEHHHVNVLDVGPDRYGQFDVVLALGLLYHVADPYRALANAAALSRARLLIESYCIDALLPPALAAEPLMRFVPDPGRFPGAGQPNLDPSNFWGFTARCLTRMVEDVGFEVRRQRVRDDRVLVDAVRAAPDRAPTRLGLAYGVQPALRRAGDPDDPRAWRIF